MANAAGPFVLVGLILLGIAVLWARQLAYRNRQAHHQDAVRLVLSIGGNLLILVGILGVATHVFLVVAPLLMVIVVLMLVMRFRSMERRMLLQCISVAAKKGIPLNQAVRGFANERTDELGYRAVVLAEALEAGMNLPDALQYSKTRLPTDALLAMRLGYETGTLGPAVARIAKADDNLDQIARSIFEKYLYLGAMALVMSGLFAFWMLKIVPVFERMFREFSLSLPYITQLNINFANYFADYYFVFVPLEVLLAVLLGVAGLHYIGFLPRGLPGISWLTLRFDSALVMRSLAIAVHFQWPLNKTVWLLARIYPMRSMRGRLVATGQQIDNGTDWCDSLFRAGIIRRADWAVLKAAQRVGNVEWALDEMADSSIRRLIYRSRLFVNIAFPIILLLLGVAVACFAIGFFMPLVNLILGLV